MVADERHEAAAARFLTTFLSMMLALFAAFALYSYYEYVLGIPATLHDLQNASSLLSVLQFGIRRRAFCSKVTRIDRLSKIATKATAMFIFCGAAPPTDTAIDGGLLIVPTG